MIKKLDSENANYFTGFFPCAPMSSHKRFFAIIGVGANIGNLKFTFHKLFLFLRGGRDIDIIKTSPLLHNPDFSDQKNPKYLNAVIAVKTNLAPKPLLRRLLAIESRMKRVRPHKNAPRTLDLDLIFFENKRGYNSDLILPHPKWRERASVIVPMLNLQGKR
ncbi:2-amino-4-hydroxy-6-hydroxymethyldihydropteridine pyrophosphokinase [Campylobacterota bacterium]|nr:2-amino-4-hydroxy-6-hydroxymethyldihydropteridine pyrophosphokinase [Campylobacterota bacterium]